MQVSDTLPHDRHAMLLAKLDVSMFSRARRRHLRENVAFPLFWTAHVRQNDIHLLTIDTIGMEDAKRTYTKAFLPRVACGGHITPRHGAAGCQPNGQD